MILQTLITVNYLRGHLLLTAKNKRPH